MHILFRFTQVGLPVFYQDDNIFGTENDQLDSNKGHSHAVYKDKEEGDDVLFKGFFKDVFVEHLDNGFQKPLDFYENSVMDSKITCPSEVTDISKGVGSVADDGSFLYLPNPQVECTVNMR